MKRIFAFFAVVLLFSGCKNNPSGPETQSPPPSLVKAVYVVSEGNFGDPSGARLTVYDVEHDSAYQDVFEAANSGQHLGSVGDDMRLYNGKAFILMSGSENLDVISLSDNHLQLSATYAGASPHDIVIDSLGNKAFITRLFKNSLLVVNLTTLVVIDSIAVGSNPQGMVLTGNQLYVCNSGYGSDKTVSVIDVGSNAVKKTILVGDGPSAAAVAPDGTIWVACTGNAFATTPTKGKIFIIDPASNTVQDSIDLDESLSGPFAIGTDGSAYLLGSTPGSFYGGPVHRIVVASKKITKSFVPGTYYGIAVDEVLGDIYVADVKDFGADGEVSIYTKDGTRKSPGSFKTRRGPSVICFKR